MFPSCPMQTNRAICNAHCVRAHFQVCSHWWRTSIGMHNCSQTHDYVFMCFSDHAGQGVETQASHVIQPSVGLRLPTVGNLTPAKVRNSIKLHCLTFIICSQRIVILNWSISHTIRTVQHLLTPMHIVKYARRNFVANISYAHTDRIFTVSRMKVHHHRY
jgi:hypothetical protein